MHSASFSRRRLPRTTLLAGLLLVGTVEIGTAAQQPTNLRAPETIQGAFTNVAWVQPDPEEEEYYPVAGDEGLSAVWSDGAFTVQIPFALETPPGEPTTILVWVGFEGFDEYSDDPEKAPGEDDAGLRWSPWVLYGSHLSGPEVPADGGATNLYVKPGLVGITRIGGPFPDDVTFSGFGVLPVRPLESVPEIGLVRASDGDPWSIADSNPQPIYRADRDGHGPFEAGRFDGNFRHSIHFPAEAPRGTYSLWFTGFADTLWRRWSDRRVEAGPLEPPTEMSGTIRAVLWAVTSEEHPSGVEVAMGYSDDVESVTPDLALWRRLPDVEVPLTTRLNGWLRSGGTSERRLGTVLDRARRDPIGDGYYLIDGSGEIGMGGGQASYHPIPAEDYGTDDPVRHGTAELSYQVQYPAEMNDFSLADVTVSGSYQSSKDSYNHWDVGIGFGSGVEDEAVNRRSEDVSMYGVWGPTSATRDVASWDDEWRDAYAAPVSGWDTCPMPDGNQALIEGTGQVKPCSLSPSGTFRYRVRPPPSGTLEPGERLLFITNLANVGTIYPTYRRRSELESTLGGISTGNVRSDPAPDRIDRFWTWYVTDYLPASTQAIERLDEARGTVTSAGMVVEEKDRRARILLASLRSDSDRENRGLMQRFGDSFGSDSPVGISQGTWDLMLQRARELNREKLAALELVDGEVDIARDHIERVLKAIEEQEERTEAVGADRPQLRLWRSFWEHHRAVSLPGLYLRGRHVSGWEAAMADLELEALDSDLRIELGNLYQQQGRSASALFQYRSAARIAQGTPDEKKANTLAAPIEAALLRSIAGKLSGEIADAREKFFGYLRGRLSGDADVSGVLGYFEHAWQVFSTGLGAVASDRVGRTDAMEGESAAVQRAGALTWLGLNGMAELAERGTSLAEMQAGLSGEELRRRLGLRRASGQPYDAGDYAELGSGIRAALALPEVQAILSESEQLLQTAFEENHFDLDSVSVAEMRADTLEYAFDITSGKNTMMLLLPHSVGTVGGSFTRLSLRPFTGSQWAAEMRWAAALGQEVRTGQQVIASLSGWERVLVKLSDARLLSTISSQLQRMHEAGGIVWKATWGSSPFMADLLLSQGIVHVAETYGGPHVAAAADALLFTFFFDPDLCATLLARSGTSTQQVRRLVATYGESVRAYRYGLEESVDATRQLRNQLSAEGQANLPWDFTGAPDLFVPGLDDLGNQRFAVGSAIQAARQGRIEEARRATAAAAALLPPARSRLEVDLEPTLEALERIPDGLGGARVQAAAGTPMRPLPTREVKSPDLVLGDTLEVRPATATPPPDTTDLGRGGGPPPDTTDIGSGAPGGSGTDTTDLGSARTGDGTVDNPGDQARRDQGGTGDPGTDDNPADQARRDEAGTGDPGTDDNPADQARRDQGGTGDPGTDDNPADQARRDQGGTGDPGTDDNPADQARRDQGGTGDAGTDDNPADQARRDGATDGPAGTVDDPDVRVPRPANRPRPVPLGTSESLPPLNAVDLSLYEANGDPVFEALNAGKLRLIAGDGAGAKLNFDQAAALVEGSHPVDIAGLRRAADDLESFQRQFPDRPAPAAPAPDVSSAALGNVASRADEGRLLKRDVADDGSVRNVVWELAGDDGRRYALKHVMPYPGRSDEMVVNAIEAETLTSVLSEFFGGTAVVPARGRLVVDADGQLVRGEVVSAWFNGDEIRDLAPGELLALREDFLESRILSIVSGDYDRHGGNYMIGQNGELIGLDWGQGHLTEGMHTPRGSSEPVDSWAYETSHHFFKTRRNQVKKFPEGECPPNLWTLEQSLTYEDAKPIIERYKQRLEGGMGDLEESIRERMHQLYVQDSGFGSVEELRAKIAELDARGVPHSLRDPDRQTELAMEHVRLRVRTQLDRWTAPWNDRVGLPGSPPSGSAERLPLSPVPFGQRLLAGSPAALRPAA